MENEQNLDIYINSFSGISSVSENDISSVEDIIFNNGPEEPPYEELIDVRSMRRLSKMLRMGIFTALKTLGKQENIKPDGIIVGTGLGCTADTYNFLMNMIQRSEHLLTPTSFIQSTHNTLAGTLGIMLKNHGYNMTWSQRYMSFYQAFEDGYNRIKNKLGSNYLITGADEMPESVQSILSSMDECRGEKQWTEGAASFLISNNKENQGIRVVSIENIETDNVKEVLTEYSSNKDHLVINANKHIKNIVSKNHIDFLGGNGRCFINDALSLDLACRLAENKNITDFNTITCVGGDSFRTTLITIS